MLKEALLKNPLIDDIISDSSPLPEYIPSDENPGLGSGHGAAGATIGAYQRVIGYCFIQGVKCTITETCIYIPQRIRTQGHANSVYGWCANGGYKDGYSYDGIPFYSISSAR